LSPAAVVMRGITKAFPGVVANDGVDFSVSRGEIHALVGENGAGKTTLMNIMYGLHRPDRGDIEINGRAVHLHSSDDAIRVGLGMVHQHFMLVPSFSVAQNITLGSETCRAGIFLDRASMRSSAEAIAKKYGLHVDLDLPVRDAPVGIKQRVEILKALYRQAEILILDEPTAVLTPQETRELFAVIRSLVAAGKTVIFITHRLKEVMEISDRVTVMRRGKVVGTMRTAETNPAELARLMVGREVLLRVDQAPPQPPGRSIFQVRDLTVFDSRGLPAVRGVSFNVHLGEVLGIAGVEGNGQTELVEAVTGMRVVEAGQISLNGKTITHATPRQRRELGLAHIPEDRHSTGLNLRASLKENASVSTYYRPPGSRWGIINFPYLETFTRQLVSEYDVRAPGISALMSTLSGGNQQKVVLARELSSRPQLLVAAQPTRGLDIGSIEFVHRRILDVRNSGNAVLLISATLDEVLSLSDRIAVMFEGGIVGIVRAREVDEERLGLMMAGISPDAEINGNPAA